jgi:hypothetical protein
VKALGYICATVLAWAYTATLSGWALSHLWLWFAVATFGVPALSIPQAIGVSMVVSYMTHHVDMSKKDPRSFGEQLAAAAAWGTCKPLFALGFGLIVRGFL